MGIMKQVLLTTLTVLSLTGQASSVVIDGPKEPLVEEKSSANLTCTGIDPNVTVEWTKDDQVLSPSDRVEFLADNGTLLIDPVLRIDSGEYRCTLSNTIQTASFILTINYGPDVRVLGVASVEEGSDVLLFCSTESVPAASVTWQVNGVSAGNSALLVIEESNYTHSGTYNCTASNSVTGISASATHVLTVTGKVSGSELSPGAAAGITAAVIFAAVGLAVGLYFLIMHLQNSSGPVFKLPRTRKNEESSRQPRADGNEQKETEFKGLSQDTRDAPRTENKRSMQDEMYMNEPAFSRSTKPPPLPDRDINWKPTRLPDEDNSSKPPKLPKRDYKMKPPKAPKPVDRTASGEYSTQLPGISN